MNISTMSIKKAVAAGFKNRQSLPDWGYRIDWIKRQRARVFLRVEKGTPSERSHKNKQLSVLHRLWNLISLLWRNRWLQEGDEIVGYSNIAIVSFQWPDDGDGEKAVMQNVYSRPALGAG